MPSRKTAPPKRITLAEDPQQEYWNILWYGLNGTGKTTDLAHMAKLGRVPFIRADRSVRKRPLQKLGIPLDNIELIDELDTEKIRLLSYEFRDRLAADPTSIAGVCIDTATELIARRLEQIVDAEWAKLTPAQQQLAKRKDITKRYFVDRDYYQPITQEMRRVVRHYVDLPCHFGISAQVRRDVDESDGHVQVGPSVNPAFQPDLLAYMDFVVRTDEDGMWPGTDEQIFVGYPRKMGKYLGKDRDHVLPSRIVEPTFDRIIAYATGALDKDHDERQIKYREARARRASGGKRGRA